MSPLPGTTLIWQDLNYFVNDRMTGQEKQILKNVNGFAKPGETVAIMGPSGAGKSSLLDILAGRILEGDKVSIQGCLSANGIKLKQSGDFAQFGAYVQQDDILHDAITAREHLEFAAAMRTGYED